MFLSQILNVIGRYHELYPAPESGKGVSITINTEWAEPKDPLDQTHYDATERFLASIFGIIAHPIYVNGDYPELLKSMINLLLFKYFIYIYACNHL